MGYPSLEYSHFGNLYHHFSIDSLLRLAIFQFLNPAPKGQQRVKTKVYSAKELQGGGLQSPGSTAHNSKTVAAVTNIGRIVGAIGRTARLGIAVPGTTTQQPVFRFITG